MPATEQEIAHLKGQLTHVWIDLQEVSAGAFQLRAALLQAVDDMQTGHSVCEATKQMMLTALGEQGKR